MDQERFDFHRLGAEVAGFSVLRLLGRRRDRRRSVPRGAARKLAPNLPWAKKNPGSCRIGVRNEILEARRARAAMVPSR